jgi:xanthine dehydrogenase accessory factor
VSVPAIPTDLAARAAALEASGQGYAVATVVSAEGATAASPGDRALLRADGTVEAGFLGGGCVTGAVRRAAMEVLADGRPLLLALRPPAALEAAGVAAGARRDGRVWARNGCPSEGSVDIFVEPVLPVPVLVVCGDGPVALALLRQAAGLGLRRHWAGAGPLAAAGPATAETVSAGPDWPEGPPAFVVIATQGRGDAEALRAALAGPARYVGLVASRRKAARLLERLSGEGAEAAALARVRSPAGLDIGARTPEEIALSILAEIVAVRRASGDGPESGAGNRVGSGVDAP